MKSYKTRAVTVILRPDEIVEVVNNKDWIGADTMDVVEEVFSMLKKVIDNKPRGLLFETPNKHYSREAVNYTNQIEVGDVARAIVLSSFGAKVMGNLYLKLTGGKPNETGRVVPVKLFSDKEEAVKWLLEEMKKSKV